MIGVRVFEVSMAVLEWMGKVIKAMTNNGGCICINS